MALAFDRHVGADRDRAQRIDRDGRERHGAVFGAGVFARLGREQGRKIAHVGHAGLDHRGKADAVAPPGRARLVAPCASVRRAAHRRSRSRSRARNRRNHRAPPPRRDRERTRHQIAADDVERIESQFYGNALHQPFQRQIKLRSAEAADQPRRHLVGQHDRGWSWRDSPRRRRRWWRRACDRAVPASARADRRHNPRYCRSAARACGRRASPRLPRSNDAVGPVLAAGRCSRRSSTHFTGRPAMRAATPSARYRERPRA